MSTGIPAVLIYAAISIVGLIILIARFKLNAFLGLILASLSVGILSGLQLTDIAKAFQEGVGSTLGFIAVVVGLGTMLGKMLAESGGAEVIAETFIRWLGPKRLDWTMLVVAFVVGLPVFFGVGLVLLVPILFTLVRHTGKPLLLLGIPLVAGLSASHGLIPPHPGPMIAIEKLGADVGKTILYALLVGFPSAIVAGPLFARWITPRITIRSGGIAQHLTATRQHAQRPGFGITLFTILLPVLLMVGATFADLLLPKGNQLRAAAAFLGTPLTSMTIAVLFSFYSFGKTCGFDRQQISKFTEECVGPAASIFLVVGAGGGFSKVLDYSGADEAIAALAQGANVSPLLLGWIVAALIRVAVGSATVTITMTAAILAPVAVSVPGTNLELLVIAMGAGSLILSHLNDGGFWFVKEYFNLTVPETLKTWTVLETIISVIALFFVLVLDWLL
jgi:GntP family gluconate:H+ symporter